MSMSVCNLENLSFIVAATLRAKFLQVNSLYISWPGWQKAILKSIFKSVRVPEKDIISFAAAEILLLWLASTTPVATPTLIGFSTSRPLLSIIVTNNPVVEHDLDPHEASYDLPEKILNKNLIYFNILELQTTKPDLFDSSVEESKAIDVPVLCKNIIILNQQINLI